MLGLFAVGCCALRSIRSGIERFKRGQNIGARPVKIAFDEEPWCEIGVEHERGRQRSDVPGFADGAIAVEQDGEVDRTFFEERPNTKINFGDVDGGDDERLSAIRRGQPLQRRHFAHTWLTPCCEEMHQDDFSSEGAQIARIAMQIVQ